MKINELKNTAFSALRFLSLAGLCLPTTLSAAGEDQSLSRRGNEPSAQRPNILWLVGEDAHASWFGCYGNTRAKTPNIDKLATEGFRFTNVFATAPVCAASRSSLITGLYSLSTGTFQMRSRYDIPHDLIKYYPDYLKEGGYFTINQTKTDYNIGGRPDSACWDIGPYPHNRAGWDPNGPNVNGWQVAKPGQPWFQVINYMETHESKAQGPVTHTRHSPDDIVLAKYHPDVLEIRENYAKYYDAIQNLDKVVGEELALLKASGQESNTIVIFCTDHGGVMPRSKRFLFDSGTHAPLIIRIPEKFKNLWPAPAPGASIDRLVSFLDFPKTWLSLTECPIPPVMQGRVFLGPHAEPEPQYIFSFRGRMDERYDNQRSVRNQQFLYVKNYMPFVAWGQHLTYLWKMVAMQAWDKFHQERKTNQLTGRFFETKPNEELYDCVADPDNVVNLADNPKYKTVLETMRGKLRDWQLTIHDTGLLPEGETDRRATENHTTIYQMSQDTKLYNLPAYLDAADLALAGDPANKPRLIEYLKSTDSGLRYWGTIGFLSLKNKMDAANLQAILRPLLSDPCGEVRAMASWILIRAGYVKSGQDCLNHLIKNPSPARLFALNVLDWMHPNSIAPYQASLMGMSSAKVSKPIGKQKMRKEKLNISPYESDMRHYLLESHGLMDNTPQTKNELP